MEGFIRFFQGTMEEPGIISWFHFIALIPIIAIAILVPFFCKDVKEKTYKLILLISWIVLIKLEIFKQLVKAYHFGEPSYWEYSIRDFPFSICSMVYYLMPIILFINKEKHPKIVDAAVGYLSFITLTMGIVVCVYTKMVTSDLIYINIQTMVHHGALIVLGVFIYVWNRKTITIKTFYRSLIAFGITAVIAILINLAFYPNFINMFFINPRRITNLPIGSVVQEKAGYPVYLIGFLALIALVTYLTYLVETSIYKLIKNKAKS